MLVLALALMIFYWIGKNAYFLLLSMAVAVIGLFIPWLAEKIHFAWMKLAQSLGFITNKIILSIIFFAVLLPLSFLSKIFGKKKLQKKTGSNSFFEERNFTYTRESLENVW